MNRRMFAKKMMQLNKYMTIISQSASDLSRDLDKNKWHLVEFYVRPLESGFELSHCRIQIVEDNMDSKWGSASGPGKDPQRKRQTKTWGKKRTNPDPKPYLKIMSKKDRVS